MFEFLDSFSFYHGASKSQCISPDIVEFIENTIEHSKSGQFMFFIRSNIPGLFCTIENLTMKRFMTNSYKNS